MRTKFWALFSGSMVIFGKTASELRKYIETPAKDDPKTEMFLSSDEDSQSVIGEVVLEYDRPHELLALGAREGHAMRALLMPSFTPKLTILDGKVSRFSKEDWLGPQFKPSVSMDEERKAKEAFAKANKELQEGTASEV